MDKQTYVVIDIETTGLDPATSEIIEIAALKYEVGEVSQVFQTLVKPHQTIPKNIIRLTGITNEMVSSAPEIHDAIENLKEFVQASVIVGHNVEFDLSFLRRYDITFGEAKFLDTLQIARFAWPTAPGYRLQSLKNQLEIRIPGQMHRAECDARVTLEIFKLALENLTNYGQDSLLKVLELAKTFTQWAYFDLFYKLLLQGQLFTASKDFKATDDTEERAGTSLFSLYSAECETQPKEGTTLSEDALIKLLSPQGDLAKIIPDYQHRPQQVDMLTEIIRCFKGGGYTVIEAGTGTGKSMAYLLPSIYWNNNTANRVVIATHTINLQEQLITKDIPYIEKVLNRKINVAIVKGRSNYLCKKKWYQRVREKGWLNEKELNFYVKCTLWLSNSICGDRSELNLRNDEMELWQDIAGDSENCLGSLCKWYNSCFGMKAKRKAEKAELLIVNHSLVFADLKSGNNVLPEYSYIIIDEAHHLEDSATEYLGYEVSIGSLTRLIKFLRKDVSDGRPGLILRINGYLGKHYEGQDDTLQRASELLDSLVSAKKEAEFAIEEIISQVNCFIEMNSKGEDVEPSSKVVRIRNNHINTDSWQSICIAGENLSLRLNRMVAGLEKLTTGFFDQDFSEESVESASLYKDIQYFISSLNSFISAMRFILAVDNNEFVYWLQRGSYKKDIILKAAPIKINRLLWEMFFQEKKGVILASATLSVEGDFKYFLNKTGLDLAPAESLRLLSVTAPFQYEKQSLLCVINNLPNPAEVEDHQYADEIAPVVAKIAEVLKGRTLCLFSSHRLLKETYNRLLVLLEKKGINLLGHNIDGGRKALVEEFISNGPSILLGANSFWEGVDIPGDLLSCVVIVKLPFSAPTIPTVEARVEQLELENLDGFYHYSLPKAVIKLKQGFGRLIRKESDRGVVVILDKRVIQKRYGRVFLGSLPIKRHFKGDVNVVTQKIYEWLDASGNSQEDFNSQPYYINDFTDIDRFIRRKNKSRVRNN